jgi:hypothetical protein
MDSSARERGEKKEVDKEEGKEKREQKEIHLHYFTLEHMLH